uniref:Uncharacterized protein n=1 Tax=Oryza rufipogon TaxID=4529 RepID=A0A0E0QLC0_ORYRU
MDRRRRGGGEFEERTEETRTQLGNGDLQLQAASRVERDSIREIHTRERADSKTRSAASSIDSTSLCIQRWTMAGRHGVLLQLGMVVASLRAFDPMGTTHCAARAPGSITANTAGNPVPAQLKWAVRTTAELRRAATADAEGFFGIAECWDPTEYTG